MGIDFSKVTPPASPTGEAGTEIETVKPYDIVADRKQMNETLVNSDEVDALVSTIEVNNLETIVSRLLTSIVLTSASTSSEFVSVSFIC